jgi:hypothetical protein
MLGTLAVAALCACQGPSLQGQASFQVAASVKEARFHERLEVSVALGRQVLATVAEIGRLSVSVRDAQNVEHQRTILPAAITAGRAVASFEELPPGPAAIDVQAFTADDRQIGRTTHQLDLRQGVTNQAELTFYLSPALPPSPSIADGQAAVTVDVRDGATIAGPPPAPVPSFNPPRVQIGHVGIEESDMVLDRTGAIWVGNARVLPDGAVLQLGGSSFQALTTNAQGQIWGHRDGKLQLLGAQAQLIREVEAPWPVPKDGLAVDGTDHLWVSAGRQLKKIASNGTVVGTFDLPSDAGAIAVDRAAGTVWVCLTKRGQVARLATNGTLLGVTTVNPFGDWVVDVALDSKGHAWVPQRFSSRVAKLRPDGTIFGTYRAPLEASRVLVDSQDQVLVAGNFDLYLNGFYKLSPEGRLLATYQIDKVWDWAFDAAGALWMIANANYYSGSLQKVTL